MVSKHTSSATGEPLLLAVGTEQTTSPSLEVTHEEWEDLCMDCGSWEWIDGELDGVVKSNEQGQSERNEFGGESGILTRKRKQDWCIYAENYALE